MGIRGARAALLAAMVVAAFATAGSAGAQGAERGIDPNQGESLVEVYLDSKAAAIELQLAADDYGISFNEHYLRRDGNGGVTVTIFGSEEELQALEAAGYSVGRVIEGPATWRERAADWQADVKAEKSAEQAALAQAGDVAPADTGEIVVLRADMFENYAGRFLSVEAKTRLATVLPQGGVYTGPTLVLAWNRGAGPPVDSDPRTMNVNVDVDTTPDTYIEHRILVRIGDAGTATPPSPTTIRIGSSTGEAKEAPVTPWLAGGLPPMASTFQSGFHTRYMDPTEVYARFDELAEEFPNLAEMITLPNKTNGYQRRAQALMAGLTNPAFTGNLNANTTATQAVILTSRAWGHEGGNDLTAEFRNPNALNSALTVSSSIWPRGLRVRSSAPPHRWWRRSTRAPPPRRLSLRPTAATPAPESSRPDRSATCPTSSRRRRTPTWSAGRSSTR
jgi:hypothetical protein